MQNRFPPVFFLNIVKNFLIFFFRTEIFQLLLVSEVLVGQGRQFLLYSGTFAVWSF